MLSREHKQRILAKFRQECNEPYIDIQKDVEAIVEEVNKALDFGSLPSMTPDEKLRCREKMHHLEGVEQITEELTKTHGEFYRDLIKQAATKHILDDMGQVYKKQNYQDPHFWPKWKAQNETQCAWI